MSKGDDPRVKTPAEQFADTYRAGHIAGLREAEAKAREFREHWSCAGGFGGHSAAARIIADTLSARITALEEEGKS